MKAQELRINNWIDVKSLNGNQDIVRTQFNYDLLRYIHLCQPIPLTPEILEKCGFVEKLNRQWSFGENPITQDYMIIVRYSKIIDGFYYQNAHFRLRYLHHLQNLVYDLSGEELEFKP